MEIVCIEDIFVQKNKFIMLTYYTGSFKTVTILIEEPLIVWLSENEDAVIVNTEKISLETEKELEAYELLMEKQG